MDIPPIGGIRSFPLGSAMRADSTAPRFEIGASSRANDEKYSPSRQSADRGFNHSQNRESDTADNDEVLAPADDLSSGTQINVVA